MSWLPVTGGTGPVSWPRKKPCLSLSETWTMMLPLSSWWTATYNVKACSPAKGPLLITVLQTLVIALGAGLGIWGVINLLEGYGNDNPGAKSQGMKQLMAGAGVAIVGMVLVPLLSGLFTV